MKSPAADDPFGPPMIGALLRVPWEAVQRHMLERLHEHGFDDLDAAHLSVFQYPGPQGRKPTELAGRLRISKQALNYLLGELERLDYLERRPDPDDQRSKRITLTPRGTAAALTIRTAVDELETTWAQQLGREHFDRLRALLLQLNEQA
jgi:DNA-binding MarR family transcriptional regulator